MDRMPPTAAPKKSPACLAITAWGHRVSPLFDTAAHLLITPVAVVGGGPTRRIQVADLTLRQKCWLMELNGVNRLICGAISRHCMERVLAHGIGVIPMICGEVEAVLGAYREGRLHQAGFFLPGRKTAGLEILPSGTGPRETRGREMPPPPRT